MKDYTFGQAKRMLSRTAYLHGKAPVGEQINDAVMALSGLNGWEFLRRIVRTSSATSLLTLPQGVAGLVRVCVNGEPASIHGTDYQFLHSGPGDLEGFMSRGFRLVPGTDVADLGFSPVMVEPPSPVFLAAVSYHYSERPQAPLTVSGLSQNGERITIKLNVGEGVPGLYPEYEQFHENVDKPLSVIDSVVLDDAADDYISLFGMTSSGVIVHFGHYHPDVKVPKFRRYKLKTSRPGPYDILAEVRIDPLPMVNDEDVVPVPSLEPIKLMMLYDVNLAMNEMQTAQQYLQQAVKWLQQMQVADNTVQSPVVQNVLFEGSGGDVESSWDL